MPTAESEWKKKNTVFIGLRLFKTTDADIIEYTDKQTNKGRFVKKALRYYIANGCPEQETKNEEEGEQE